MANKTYISPQQAYHDINMGDAGVAKINLKTGLASAVIPLVNLPGNHMPLKLELVFNGGQINDFHMGYGFKLGCMQKLVYNSADESLTYTDAGMCEHIFKKQKHNDKFFWSDTSGMGLTIEIEYNNYVMYDSNGLKYYFDNGVLNAISNKKGYFLRFAYTNGKMTQVIDDTGKTADLMYGNDGNISKITIGEHIITFEYDDNKLVKLYIPSKGSISFTYSQGSVPIPGVSAYQHIAYYLTSVVNPCGQEYTFTLNSDKIVQEVNMYSHHKTIPANTSEDMTTLMDKHTLQYVNDYTTWITNNKGITYTYSMDEYGTLVSCWEGVEDNFYGDIQFISSGKNTVKLNSTIPYSSTWVNGSYNVGTYSTDTLIKSFTSEEINNVKNKMIVVSSFLKVAETNSTTPFGALAVKIGTSNGSIEWFNAIYEPKNNTWQFVATATYVPNDCNSIAIYAKCTGVTTRFTKMRVQTPNVTASQQVIYLADNNGQISKVCPISQIEQVKYIYDDIILEPGDYEIERKTEYKNINQFYSSDIQNLLSQYGTYKVVSCLGGRFKQSYVRNLF